MTFSIVLSKLCQCLPQNSNPMVVIRIEKLSIFNVYVFALGGHTCPDNFGLPSLNRKTLDKYLVMLLTLMLLVAIFTIQIDAKS